MSNSEGHKLKLKNRIAYKQSRFVVVLAFGLGFFFSLTMIYVDYLKQVTALTDNVHQVVNTMRQPASEAAFHLDPELAEQVANGLFEYSAIVKVEIFGILGSDLLKERLVSKERDFPTQEYKWLSSVLFGEKQVYSVPLVFQKGNSNVGVGALIVNASPNNIASAFIDRSMNGIAFGIIRTGIFALIVLCFFFYNFSSGCGINYGINIQLLKNYLVKKVI